MVVMLTLAASSVAIVSVAPAARALILYDSGNPTPDEQLVLEYINRARANPIAEGQRLGIDIHEGLEDDPPDCYGPEYVGVRPPLAMNPALLSIAEAHSEDMYNQNYFSHTDPNGTTAFERMTNAGYNYINAGENIGAGTDMSATDLEDTLMVDAGYPCRAHRMNLLDIFPYPPPAYYEVGIGYYEGPSGQAFITQDFGTAVNTTPFLTGVVYNDANGAGFYAIGEGIAGVTVTPNVGDYYAISSSSGGYAFPIPSSGTITVTASGNGFGPISQTITLTGTNVELDFTPQGLSSMTTAIQSTTETTSQSTSETITQPTTQTLPPPTTYSTTVLQTTTQTSSQLTAQTSSYSTTQPLLQSVTFQSTPSAFGGASFPATITACGGTYTNFQSTNACELNFNATANLPSPPTGWQFNHWAWTGGVACESDTANPVGCSAYNSGGVLIAFYAAQVNVSVNPSSLALVSWGSCSGSGFGNGASFYSTNFGLTQANACNIHAGYTFASWSCSGGLACEASADPTTVSLTGPGSITLNLQPQQSNNTSSIASSSLYASTVGASTSTSGPIVTSMTASSEASVSPQLTVPAIPGFTWESILAGAILGMFALAYSKKRK